MRRRGSDDEIEIIRPQVVGDSITAVQADGSPLRLPLDQGWDVKGIDAGKTFEAFFFGGLGLFFVIGFIVWVTDDSPWTIRRD